MSKKDNKNTQKKESEKGLNIIIIVSVAVFIIIAGYMIIRSSDKDNSHLRTISETEHTTETKLIETRPILPAGMWSGKAAEAYRLAAEIPHVVDAQYCYCDCSKNPKFMHKTLLTCYTDNHGAECSICQNEVFKSYDLYKKGYSIPDIKKEVDKEFSKHGGHMG